MAIPNGNNITPHIEQYKADAASVFVVFVLVEALASKMSIVLSLVYEFACLTTVCLLVPALDFVSYIKQSFCRSSKTF